MGRGSIGLKNKLTKVFIRSKPSAPAEQIEISNKIETLSIESEPDTQVKDCPVDHPSVFASEEEKADYLRPTGISLPDDKYEGWPRNFVKQGRTTTNRGLPMSEQMPVVWSEAESNLNAQEWAQMPDPRAMSKAWASGFSVCDVCGKDLGEEIVYATIDSDSGHFNTNGLGLHPRCALLANKFCPHFSEVKAEKNPADHEGYFFVSRTGVAVDKEALRKDIPYSEEEIARVMALDPAEFSADPRNQEINDVIYGKPDFKLNSDQLEPITIDEIKKLETNGEETSDAKGGCPVKH